MLDVLLRKYIGRATNVMTVVNLDFTQSHCIRLHCFQSQIKEGFLGPVGLTKWPENRRGQLPAEVGTP